MAAGSVVAFWVVAVLVILVPGPDWAFTLAAGLRGHVLAAAGGIVLGYVAMTLVVAAGVGALVDSTPHALTALTLIGGVYLIWLGVKLIRSPASPASPVAVDDASSPASGAITDRSTVVQGAAVSGFNPKALLIFVALLPQFTDDAWALPLPIQIGVLGLVFTATCGVVYLIVGATARSMLSARPGAAATMSRLSAAAMILLGAFLLIQRAAA